MKYLKLTERFNADKLNYIINNYEDLIKDVKEYKSSKSHLQNYLNNSYDGKINVFYKQADYGGRFNAVKSLSLQNLKRSIRHTISNEYYKDIDVENAHPIILLYLCKKNGFDCPNLEEYINNREELLKQTGLDRNKAKEQYLILTNTDEDYFECNTLHMKNYKNEMKTIHKLFVNKNIDEFKKVKKERTQRGKNGNHEASYVNRLLCDMENNILMCIYKFFDSPKDCVLCFDGIMIDKNITPNLEECEKYIKDNIGIDIKLKIKEMNNILPIPNNIPKYNYNKYKLDYYEDVYELQEKTIHKDIIKKWFDNVISIRDKGGDYDYIVKTCNGYILTKKNVFNANMGDIKCNIINNEYNEEYHKENPKSKEFKCKKYIATHLGKSKNGFLSIYLSKIKRYNKLDYIPYIQNKKPNIDKYTFNMFDSYKYDNNEPYDINVFTNSKLFKLLRDNFFNKDLIAFNYFLDYIADIFQDTTNLSGTAYVFSSEQGCGKGTLAKFLQKLFDEKNISIIDNVDNYFESRFNSLTSNKLIKIFEELGESGSAFKHHNRLKAEITSNVNRVEPKGFEAYETMNCARYIFFGNYKGGTYVPHNDRRYNICHINSERANDLVLFKEIHKDINNPFYMRSAFKFFTTRNYDKLKIMVAYESKYKIEQKLEQLSLPFKFIISYVETHYKKLDDINQKILVNDLYTAYSLWCQSEGHRGRNAGSAHILRKHLKEVDIIPTTQRYGKTTKRCFVINTIKLQKDLQKYLHNETYQFNFE